MTNNLQKFILFSLIIHAIVVVSFSIKWYVSTKQATTSIDVVLIKEKSTNDQQPDYLAQNDNAGGGDAEQKNIPSSDPVALPSDQLQNQISKDYEQAETIETKENAIDFDNQDSPLSTKNTKTDAIINNELAHDQDIAKNPAASLPPNPEMTALMQNIADRQQMYTKRTKKRFVSASTRADRDVVYLDQWRKKIEYFGNKYYPSQAKERNLSGDVLLLVAVDTDGQLKYVRIERSSGIKILDDAAVQAVHLAAPFEQFTQDMRKDTDILEIIRTWRFNEDGALQMAMQ